MKDPQVFSKLIVNYQLVSTAAMVVLFGASAHTAAQIKRARETRKKYTLVDVVTSIIIAAFSGLMFSITAAYFFEDPMAVYMCGGAGGFLGLQGVNALANAVLKTLIRVGND